MLPKTTAQSDALSRKASSLNSPLGGHFRQKVDNAGEMHPEFMINMSGGVLSSLTFFAFSSVEYCK